MLQWPFPSPCPTLQTHLATRRKRLTSGKATASKQRMARRPFQLRRSTPAGRDHSGPRLRIQLQGDCRRLSRGSLHSLFKSPLPRARQIILSRSKNQGGSSSKPTRAGNEIQTPVQSNHPATHTKVSCTGTKQILYWSGICFPNFFWVSQPHCLVGLHATFMTARPSGRGPRAGLQQAVCDLTQPS